MNAFPTGPMYHAGVLFVWLIACSEPAAPGDTSADAPADSGGAPRESERSLADADATVLGESSGAAGNAVAFTGDGDGDGVSGVAIASYFGARVCTWETLTPGAHRLDDADGCYVGAGQTEYPGYAISGGSDLTGDGVNDLAIGAIGGDDVGAYTGKVYVIGGPSPRGEYGSESAEAVLIGEASADYAGSTIAFLGDMDGDGAGDLAIGAPANDEGGGGAGKAYVVSGPVSGTIDLAAAAAVIGLGAVTKVRLYHGAPGEGDGVGSVIDAAGDMNGDGLAELVLGVNGSDVGGKDGGAVSVFFGGMAAAVHPLADADLTWTGVVGAYAGDAVAGVGDLDGDGLDDLVASDDMLVNGRVWFLTGAHVGGQMTMAATSFQGEATGDLAGSALAVAGDTDGDGTRDVLVGAYSNDGGAQDAGAVYLLRGPFLPGALAASDAALVLLGESEGDSAGRALTGGWDATGDGAPDLLIGAVYSDVGGPFAGAAYLVSP